MFRQGLFLCNSKLTFQLKSWTKRDPCQWLATGTKNLCHLTPLPTSFVTKMMCTHIQTESNPQPLFMSSVTKTHLEETWDFGWLLLEVYQWNLAYPVSCFLQHFFNVGTPSGVHILTTFCGLYFNHQLRITFHNFNNLLHFMWAAFMYCIYTCISDLWVLSSCIACFLLLFSGPWILIYRQNSIFLLPTRIHF